MIKRTFLLFIFVVSATAQAQMLYQSSGNAFKDTATMLGAINGAKIYAERCFSTGAIASPSSIDAVTKRLRAYEKLEIEMHYYLIRDAMKIGKLSSVDSADQMQLLLLNSRQELAASIDSKSLPPGCLNFVANATTSTGDFNYIYSDLLKVIREAR